MCLWLLTLWLYGDVFMVKGAPLDFDVNPNRIYDATMSATRIYIVVLHAGDIAVFDLEGKAVHRIGKKGSGPGEFSFPVAAHVDGDFLYVLDNGKQKLFRIDAASGDFLEDWSMVPGNALAVRDESFLVGYNMDRQPGMFAYGTLDPGLPVAHYFFKDPCCLDVRGSKRSGVLFDHDGNLWVAYSGAFHLQKFDSGGRKLLDVTQPGVGYVAPSPFQGSRFDQSSSAAHFRTFDKISGLFEVGSYIALYRFKSDNQRMLDLFTQEGVFVRSVPINAFEPIGAQGNVLHMLMMGEETDTWDVALTQMVFR